MKIIKPTPDEYAPYYEHYISLVDAKDPIRELKRSKKQLVKFISSLNKKQLNYRYAEGKWTIKEILMHVTDAERIFTYRALRFARKDQTPLPAFEENDYAPASKATERKIKSILKEFEAVRNATIALYENLDGDMLLRTGTANNQRISVRALLYISLGHQRHHLKIIKERYLN